MADQLAAWLRNAVGHCNAGTTMEALESRAKSVSQASVRAGWSETPIITKTAKAWRLRDLGTGKEVSLPVQDRYTAKELRAFLKVFQVMLERREEELNRVSEAAKALLATKSAEEIISILTPSKRGRPRQGSDEETTIEKVRAYATKNDTTMIDAARHLGLTDEAWKAISKRQRGRKSRSDSFLGSKRRK